MIPKPIEQIQESDLRALIEEGVREGVRLEYKQKIAYDADGKRNLLKAVNSLANTQGGDLIIGMEADVNDNALPVALPGLKVDDSDSEELKLQQIIRHNLEPLVSGHVIKTVALESGNSAFVVRIPKSWRAPHRVKGSRVFYGRSSSGAYELEVPEIRRAFLLSEGQAERIQTFIADRLIAIRAGDLPVPLMDQARIVLHLVPIGALEPGAEFFSTQDLTASRLDTFSGERAWGRLTIDGYVSWWPTDREDLVAEHDGYAAVVKLSRFGVIESVDAFFLRGGIDGPIPGLSFEQKLLSITSEYLALLHDHEVRPPVYLFLNLLGVKGKRLGLPNRMLGTHVWGTNIHPLDRDHLLFPEVVVTDYETGVLRLLQDWLNLFWNAFGVPISPYSDDERIPPDS